MAQNEQLTSYKGNSSSINELSIVSNKTKTPIDISAGVSDLYYFESILDPSIKVELMFTDTGVTSLGGKTVLEGLPIVREEKTRVVITDNSENKLELTLYVDKVNLAFQDTRKNLVGLRLVSKEYMIDENTRVNTRFDGKISNHIKRILTDKKFLDSEKELDIETTGNTLNIIGNNRKPFTLCLLLSKYSVPSTPGANQNSAGYFFWETSYGIKFQSIEKLLSTKPVKKLIYNETHDDRGQSIPGGYDGKIVELSPGTMGDSKRSLESGANASRIILFDPFNCYYEVVNVRASQTEKNINLAGEQFPVLNSELRRSGQGDLEYSRTTYMTIDRGSLPTGNTREQISKSKEQNFDPKNILNQSIMRYNQLFAIVITITVPGDFSLHAGDILQVDIPEVADKKSKESSNHLGGIYMIADLCHYMTTSKTYTKMNLVRDSFGKKIKN
jgi:hypothetical protein